MRKEYIVRIVLDDSIGTENASALINPSRADMHVYIDPAKQGKQLADTLAHELGHVVQRIAMVPEYTNDPRANPQHAAFMRIVGPSQEERDRIFANEADAWSRANIIRGGKVDKKLAKRALDSYKEGV